MATIQEIRRENIANAAVSLSVTHVDNQVTVALNGVEIAQLTGPPGFQQFQENLSGQIVAGRPNVLVVTLVNFAGGGFNPAAIQAVLNVGGEEINLSASSGQSVAQGLFAQFIIILQR